jgi:hypothetical protein
VPQVGISSAKNNRKRGRNVHVDALRGLTLVVMTVHHFPSLFLTYSIEVLGYVTTGESFVFLSGLVAGSAYTRYSAAESGALLWRRAFTRAGFLYSFHLLTFLTFFCLATLFSIKTWGLENWTPRFYEHPASALFMGITLTYQPPYLDLLPMYGLFILLVPITVQFGKKNQLGLVLLCSAIVWLLVQFGLSGYLQGVLLKFWPVDFGTYDIFAWQLMFVLGVCTSVLGATNLIPHQFRWLVMIVCVIVAAVLFSIRHGLIFSESGLKIDSLSLLGSLGPIRLLNFIVIAWLVQYTLSGLAENLVVKGLALLGRHSLEVFTFHVFLIYFFFGVVLYSQFQELWVLLFVSSLFLPACLFERYQNPWKSWFYRLVSA